MNRSVVDKLIVTVQRGILSSLYAILENSHLAETSVLEARSRAENMAAMIAAKASRRTVLVHNIGPLS